MNRRDFTSQVSAAMALWVWAAQAQALSLSDADASAGLKAALDHGAAAAVALLGRTDGFLGNPKVRIPLPGGLESAAKLLRGLGQGQKVDDLVIKSFLSTYFRTRHLSDPILTPYSPHIHPISTPYSSHIHPTIGIWGRHGISMG